MLLKLLATVALLLSLMLQALLVSGLATQSGIAVLPLMWLFLHAFAALVAAGGISFFADELMPNKNNSLFLFSFSLCFAIPFIGTIGSLGALIYGIYHSNNRHEEYVYWQVTKNTELPFTTPMERGVAKLDSRGFVEQLVYSERTDELYGKVLAANNIKNSLSVGALKAAVKHPDERIRLTAYQTLDKKVSHLNKQIQQLELSARGQGVKDQSNTWLQIASNYWELLTLEKDEPIAKEQLLKKASEAAINAVRILPTNRNAHFTLGRIALLQGKDRVAAVAFERSMALGMPMEKAMPYRAEAAFQARDFAKVAESIEQVEDSYKAYPPLCHVAGYWS